MAINVSDLPPKYQAQAMKKKMLKDRFGYDITEA